MAAERLRTRSNVMCPSCTVNTGLICNRALRPDWRRLARPPRRRYSEVVENAENIGAPNDIGQRRSDLIDRTPHRRHPGGSQDNAAHPECHCRESMTAIGRPRISLAASSGAP